MRGFDVMRVAGIRIVIDPSWLFIFFLVVWSLATGYFPEASPPISGRDAWILGVVAALLLFGSVLVHELSHAFLAQRAGIPVPRIRLFLFGGVSEMASEPHDPRTEIRIAAAGPLTSFALAAGFYVLSVTGLPSLVSGGRQVADYLIAINLALGLFNLLPGFPLDGGRILRAWLWARRGDLLSATRSAGRAGSIVGFGLMGLGLWQLVKNHNLGGLWLMVIGIFLNQAASASFEVLLLRDTLSGYRVRQVMTQPVVAVPEHASLEELAHDFFFRHPRGSFPVTSGSEEQFAGMVSLDQLKGVPREEWSRTPVRQVMTPAARLRPLDPDDDCATALEIMMRGDVGRLPVVAGGRIAGILSRRDIMRLFKIRSDLST
ncbi:MAG TPA: site-2 protease family protein [Candidatus Polarisedimenticolia bacterium]|nr:site-2 protease family protein [Candidatus Polarisedimenticolia bacterium]